jgi:hypothetical protein
MGGPRDGSSVFLVKKVVKRDGMGLGLTLFVFG